MISMTKNKDLIIFIVSAGPNVPITGKENLSETIESFEANIGDGVDYGYCIVTDNRDQYLFINELFSDKDSLIEVVYSQQSWAKDYNQFMEKYIDSTDYILYSHDDLTINTPNFFNEVMEQIKDKEEPIGWISFTNDRYYRYDGRALSNSFKDPFALDRKNDPRIYECHKFNDGESVTNDNVNLLDYPQGVVKVCSPFPHLCLVSSESMKKIGPCSDWTEYTILIDDDWGLEALKKNLFNIWIPSIGYTHPNPKYSPYRKPGTDLRWMQQAFQRFKEKWGFHVSPSEEEIEFVREKYKDTNIPMFSYRNTYDWDYLK